MGNSEEIFSLALGLENPWSKKELVFNKESLQLDIHLEFKKGPNSYTISRLETLASNYTPHRCI
jgi:hypothetical protein